MSERPKVVLCGFMGTGKSTVGTRLAERSGGRLVDLDEAIEARFGMPIRRVFAERGEQDFRAAERELCERVEDLDADVVAVGGGAVVDPANRGHLARFGTLVCLRAPIDALEQRLAPSREHRPVLGRDEPLASRIRALLETRRATYAAIPWQVDTTGRTPDEVCDVIERELPLRHRLPTLSRLDRKSVV